MLISIRIENDRPAFELGFQTIGIEFGLLLANARVPAGLFRFDQGQGQPVVTPQDVINISLAPLIGHACELEFQVLLLIEGPSRLFQKQINEIVPGLRFRIVVRIRNGRAFLFRFGYFGLEALYLIVQGGFVGQKGRQFFVPLLQARFQLLELVLGLFGDGGGLGKCGRVEGQAGRWAGSTGIGMREPIGEVEKFPDGCHGI